MATHTAGRAANQSELIGSEVVPRQRGEKGMIALLAATLPHGQMERRYKKRWMEGRIFPAQAAPIQLGLFWVSPLQAVVFLGTPAGFLDLRAVRSWLHVCKAYSPSCRAIIISIDGFNVPPSIRFPNYTVERCAVVNKLNQINEFGYLDSIIAPSPSSLLYATHTIILYSKNMSSD